MSFVTKDYYESNIRKILNFGHTFAHPIELLYKVSHGLAVLEGIKIALRLSEKLCHLQNKIAEKINYTISKIDPYNLNINKQLIFEKIYNDKKTFGENIDLILLKNIAQPIIYKIKLNKLEKIYYDLP